MSITYENNVNQNSQMDVSMSPVRNSKKNDEFISTNTGMMMIYIYIYMYIYIYI
jgi:hypothetical protein